MLLATAETTPRGWTKRVRGPAGEVEVTFAPDDQPADVRRKLAAACGLAANELVLFSGGRPIDGLAGPGGAHQPQGWGGWTAAEWQAWETASAAPPTPWKPSSGAAVGAGGTALRNAGNSCYLTSAVQCLVAAGVTAGVGAGSEVARSYTALRGTLAVDGNGARAAAVWPARLEAAVADASAGLYCGPERCPRDAAQFLHWLVDRLYPVAGTSPTVTLQSRGRRRARRRVVSAGAALAPAHRPPCTAPSDVLVGHALPACVRRAAAAEWRRHRLAAGVAGLPPLEGQACAVAHCGGCGAMSTEIESFRALRLRPEEVPSGTGAPPWLAACLDFLHWPLPGLPRACRGCGHWGPVSQRLVVTRPPAVLLVSVASADAAGGQAGCTPPRMRYTAGGLALDLRSGQLRPARPPLAPHRCGKRRQRRVGYELVAVLCHSASAGRAHRPADAGHYTAAVRSPGASVAAGPRWGYYHDDLAPAPVPICAEEAPPPGACHLLFRRSC
jgi:hypothetical protein